ncbi:MAG: hypothetical protein C0167_03925 [Nitrososphaera sp.]|nr:MAG: hypothetical protein C0167_03925 [Nitrososphaera sp.]
MFAEANYVERIAPELMSRFYTLRFREYTPDEYVRVATAVLTKREGVPPELAEHVVMRLLRDVGTRDVRDAVKVARLANGDRAVADSILDYMAEQRRGAHESF